MNGITEQREGEGKGGLCAQHISCTHALRTHVRPQFQTDINDAEGLHETPAPTL